MAQWQRICLPVQETQVGSLGQEDPLEKEMATHSTILAWEIPWTKEPDGLQAMRSQRVRHYLATKQQQSFVNTVVHVLYQICFPKVFPSVSYLSFLQQNL